MKKTKLRVFPNPWSFIHPELGPQGACPAEPINQNTHRGYVGATVHATQRQERWDEPKRWGTHQRGMHGVHLEFIEGGVIVPASKYYSDRLHDGSLVPADEATLKEAGKSRVRFKTLAEAKAAGIAEFEAINGSGSWAALVTELGLEPAPAQTKVAPKAARTLIPEN